MAKWTNDACNCSEGSSGHYVEGERPMSKGYTLCDSTDIRFLKWQHYSDEEHSRIRGRGRVWLTRSKYHKEISVRWWNGFTSWLWERSLVSTYMIKFYRAIHQKGREGRRGKEERRRRGRKGDRAYVPVLSSAPVPGSTGGQRKRRVDSVPHG